MEEICTARQKLDNGLDRITAMAKDYPSCKTDVIRYTALVGELTKDFANKMENDFNKVCVHCGELR